MTSTSDEFFFCLINTSIDVYSSSGMPRGSMINVVVLPRVINTARRFAALLSGGCGAVSHAAVSLREQRLNIRYRNSGYVSEIADFTFLNVLAHVVA